MQLRCLVEVQKIQMNYQIVNNQRLSVHVTSNIVQISKKNLSAQKFN